MICFCAERFPWRRLWQNPGALLPPGLTDMATRALLYRRPHEPKTLLITHGSQYFAFRLREARRDLQRAAESYAGELGVKVKRLSIRDQSSRWGSCTSAGSLSFSWRLILAPPYVLDYLAAHEVAHLVEMNHSARFWRVCGKVCDHVERAKNWLDTHGNDLHRYGIEE